MAMAVTGRPLQRDGWVRHFTQASFIFFSTGAAKEVWSHFWQDW